MTPSQFLAQASEFFPENIAETVGSFFSIGTELSNDVIETIVLLISAVILLVVFRSTWLYWRNELFKKAIKWTLMEIKVPREIRKSPRAMEQVLASIHALRNVPSDISERYWIGEVTRWYSLEIVSFGGETHFYIRFYHKQRSLIESSFFAYYPDVELAEVDDYTDRLPQSIPEMYTQGYEIWGTEMMLAKPEAYPIKTYPNFEAIDEEKKFDPASTFLEVLGKVKKEEIVGIQILIAPKAHQWKDRWTGLVEKLREASMKKVKSQVGQTGEIREFARALARTPGETEVLKAVEMNLSKPAFDTLIRFMYLSPKQLFYDSFARRGLAGAFNQYSALDLNSFVQNYRMGTRTRFWQWPHIFPRKRNEVRKQRLLWNYHHREVPPETFVGRLITSNLLHLNFSSRMFAMNTEAIATLFHPPSYFVLTAPHIKRVESRKTGPPAGLAIFGEEEQIEKFK